jgi:hypothetical protein
LSSKRRTIAGVATVVVAGLATVGALVLLDRGNGDEGPASQIVAVAEGALVVLDADDGSIVRTLATGEFDPIREIQDLSVTPDGQHVYFERHSGPACDMPEIVTMPVAGGDEQFVTRGFSPMVSPDGRTLAYSRLVEPERCLDALLFELVVLDLETGSERRWSLPELVSEPWPIGWATDTRLVVLQVGGSDAIWNVDTRSEPGELGPANTSPIVLPGPSADPKGLTPAGELVTWDRETGQVRTSDLGTGRVLADLFTLPTDIGLAGRIDVDSTGDNLIMTGGLKEADSLPMLGRWARGQRAPTVLDTSGQSPVWLP